MEGDSSELDGGCADPATEDIKQNADAIFDHTITSPTRSSFISGTTPI